MQRLNIKREITRRWIDRPETLKSYGYTEGFAYDLTWEAGLRLHSNRHRHYQEVMALIRPLVVG